MRRPRPRPRPHSRPRVRHFLLPRAADVLCLLLAAILVPVVSVTAQQAATAKTPAATSGASGLKVLNVDDYGRWKRVTSADLSADGTWMTYAYAPNDGDDTLFVKGLDNGKLYTVPRGASPKFSDDSHWVGYFVSPPEREGRGARSGGRGATPPGRGGRGGGADASGPRTFELLNLATGDKWEAPNAQAFEFSNGAHYLAVHLNKASRADTSHSGSDLLLRTLADASTRNIGNVDQYHFDDAGSLLAYTVDATDNLGNGVYLVEPASGATRVLDAAAAEFDGLAWSDHGTDLAALRGATPKDMKQRANVLLAWTGLSAQGGRETVYDPATAADFPKGYVLSEFSTPDWSDDGSRVFVGIKAQEAAQPKDDEPQANVDVWHWKDDEVQSVQIVQLQRERRSTLSGVVLLSHGTFVQLADSAMANVQLVADGQWGVGRNDTTFRGEVAWGGSHANYYAVNTTTGARALIADTLMRTMGTSPDSKWFLYLKNGHIYAYNFAAARSTPVDGGMDFVDTDDDHAYERPIWGLAGWSRDGHDVLVYDKYDLWALPLDGAGKPVNLTKGVGKAQQIEFKVVRLDLPGGGGRGGFGGFGGGGARADDHGIDLSKPITLSAYGEWTKKSGYWVLDPGKAPRALIYEDKQVGSASKAEKADRVIFTQQTFREFPDYWVSGTDFTSPRQVTDADPFINEYAWGSKVLIDFTNARGQHLQGTLTLPAGYEPGKKYPMLVYFYEILSNTHHSFSMPRYDDRPQMSTYASNGYLVFEPDVRYQIGAPGSSALDCVTSGVKKVIALGYADPAHIGLQGHSWGGYQSSYILTQTSMFAAVVTGAPPTDLISFYDETYPGTGTLQQGITEVGQVRIGKDVTPWNHTKLYEDQSALFNAPKITTPFLILQGTADNAVDWHQGLELYAAARRLGKKVIFLSYPGEPHHLAKKPNQIDFQIRMKQFFDHYLKGASEPDWMKNGVPQVHKGEPIR